MASGNPFGNPAETDLSSVYAAYNPQASAATQAGQAASDEAALLQAKVRELGVDPAALSTFTDTQLRTLSTRLYEIEKTWKNQGAYWSKTNGSWTLNLPPQAQGNPQTQGPGAPNNVPTMPGRPDWMPQPQPGSKTATPGIPAPGSKTATPGIPAPGSKSPALPGLPAATQVGPNGQIPRPDAEVEAMIRRDVTAQLAAQGITDPNVINQHVRDQMAVRHQAAGGVPAWVTPATGGNINSGGRSPQQIAQELIASLQGLGEYDTQGEQAQLHAALSQQFGAQVSQLAQSAGMDFQSAHNFAMSLNPYLQQALDTALRQAGVPNALGPWASGNVVNSAGQYSVFSSDVPGAGGLGQVDPASYTPPWLTDVSQTGGTTGGGAAGQPATAPTQAGVTSPGVLDQADIDALKRYIANLTASGNDPAKLALYQQRLSDYQSRLAAPTVQMPAPTPTPTPTSYSNPDMGLQPVQMPTPGLPTGSPTGPGGVPAAPAPVDYSKSIATLNQYIANLTASGNDPAKLATYQSRLADYSGRQEAYTNYQSQPTMVTQPAPTTTASSGVDQYGRTVEQQMAATAALRASLGIR